MSFVQIKNFEGDYDAVVNQVNEFLKNKTSKATVFHHIPLPSGVVLVRIEVYYYT